MAVNPANFAPALKKDILKNKKKKKSYSQKAIQTVASQLPGS